MCCARARPPLLTSTLSMPSMALAPSRCRPSRPHCTAIMIHETCVQHGYNRGARCRVLIAPWVEAARGARALIFMSGTRRNGHAMSEDDEVQGTSISQAHTLEEIADFWDARSLDDYWEQTHEAAFEVRAKRRRRVALEPDI